MWRDGQCDLAGGLEVTGGGGRQFVVRKRILVIQVPVNDHLIAEPLVIEGRKSTIVFKRWKGAGELVEVEERRPGSAIGVGRSGAQPIGTEGRMTKENARQTLFIANWSEARRRRSTSFDNLIVGQRQIFRR